MTPGMPDQEHYEERFKCVLKTMRDAGASDRGGLTVAEIADVSGLLMSDVLVTCRVAVAEGYLQRIGFKTEGPVYALTPKGIAVAHNLKTSLV